MKRILVCLMIAVFLLNNLAVVGNAAVASVEKISFDDGSYIIVEIVSSTARASGSKMASKQYTYYDADSVSQWKAVLTGKFTYTGTSATCTSSSIDVTIYDSAWYVSSRNASKSGNTARGSVTMGEKLLGVTVSSVPVSLSLSCDANGNLS